MKYFWFIILFLSITSSFARGTDTVDNTDKGLQSQDPDVQKYLDEEIDFSPVEHKKRWDNGHVFLPQDPKVYEEYLEGSLNKTGDYHAYDFARAIELTMYYLGFDKNVFYAFGWNCRPEEYRYDVPNYFLVHSRKEIRDKQKAVYWLEKAKILAKRVHHNSEYFYLTLSCRIEGLMEFENKDYFTRGHDYGNRNYEFAIKIYLMYQENKKAGKYDPEMIEKLDKKFENDLYIRRYLYKKYKEIDRGFGNNPIMAYVYYKGIVLEKNLELAKRYIYMLPPYVWRIFWAGWIVPKDQEFAKYILRVHDTPYSRAQLKRIESGYYDDRD